MLNNIVKKYKNIIFDCDGVLWRKGNTIEYSKDFIKYLKNNNINTFFLTNNSTYTSEQLKQNIKNKLDYDIDTNYCLTSLDLLKHKISLNMKIKKIYIIGNDVMINFFKKLNYTVYINSELNDSNIYKDIDAVLIGFTKNIDYNQLVLATNYLKKNVLFFGTNQDNATKIEDIYLPGTGCLIKYLEYSSDKKCNIVGKPNIIGFNILKNKYKLKNEECLFIGDNLETDIKFSKNSSIDSLLVLTGVTNKDDKKIEEIKPNYIFDNLNLIN